MEDLFWDKPAVNKIYDLKGSQRNRLTKESGSKTQHGQIVLLDSNYLSSMTDSPIYLNKSAYLGKLVQPSNFGEVRLDAVWYQGRPDLKGNTFSLLLTKPFIRFRNFCYYSNRK